LTANLKSKIGWKHIATPVVVCPEITSGHNNFELREFHFIFGDACTAIVVEAREESRSNSAFEVVGTKLRTQFSNNIRNDFGFLNRSEEPPRDPLDLVFRQNGRDVFHDVCPMVADHIAEHLSQHEIDRHSVKRLWLHQANLAMNKLIAKTLLGRDAEKDESPVILDEYANTSSAGSVIAFHKFHEDFVPGDLGVLCSFGAGYSVGSIILRRLE
jgi:beta-ketodecanoyl-[acyl-carrier-protein] synthase